MSSSYSAKFGIFCVLLFFTFLLLSIAGVFVSAAYGFGIARMSDEDVLDRDVTSLEKADIVVLDWGSGTKVCFFISISEKEIEIARFDSYFNQSHLLKFTKILDTASREKEPEKYRDLLVLGVLERFEIE